MPVVPMLRKVVTAICMLLAAWAMPVLGQQDGAEIKSIEIEGNEKTAAQVINQELVIREGDEFDPEKMELSRQNIMDLLASPPKKPLHERIAQHNRDTISTMGVEAFSAKVEAIRADRDESYARILGYGRGDEEQVE